MSDVDVLVAARSDLINTLAAEEIYQRTKGAKPQYTLDGESYNWPDYRLKALAAITEYTKTIALLSSPFEVRSFDLS